MTKILLVEDDKSLREIYGVRLLAEGYDIVSAGDGEEALAMAIKDRPDLIVSDVMMPKISGFDMLDILRSTTETKNIKVIMMTALSSEDQRQRGVALGADRYLVKSQVGIEDVVRTVHEVLADAPIATPATPLTANHPTAPSSSFATPPTHPAAAPTAPRPAGIGPSVMSPQPQAASLPQPTAPFSTPRPGNLADRVIQPLDSNPGAPDFEHMMNQELSQANPNPFEEKPAVQPGSTDTNIPPAPESAVPAPSALPVPSAPPAPMTAAPETPAPTPVSAPAAPQPSSAPASPSPQAMTPGPHGAVDFEETPHTDAPQPASPLQVPPMPQPPTMPPQGPSVGV